MSSMDKELRMMVVDELDFEPSVNGEHIGVAVDGRAVRLTGHVANYAEKVAAITAVRRVKGVRAVADNLEIRFPSDKKLSDDEIAKRAVSILKWDTLVPPDAVQVTVKNGHVILTGEVKWWHQKHSAEQDILRLSGVTAVSNEITVAPTVAIADVKGAIEKALKRRIEAEVNNIRVTVHSDNTVILDGKVQSFNEKWAARSAALAAPGVTNVKDQLQIV